MPGGLRAIFVWSRAASPGVSGAQAPRQNIDRADDPPGDPGGTDTGCHTGLLVRGEVDSIAMDELDLVGDAEFFSTEFRLLGEQLSCRCRGGALGFPLPDAALRRA